MKYWKSYKDEEENIYSCDMIRVNFRYHDSVDEKSFDKYFGNINRVDVETLPSMSTPLKFRYMLKVNFEHGNSCMVVGFHFNALGKEGVNRGYIEFNPNKCMCEQLKTDLEFIRIRSKEFYVTRWDLAIDIPRHRNDCVLVKDSRMYQLVMHSIEDRTEYLGQRSHEGYIKLYNKTKESNLDYDLTRLELTLGKLNDSVSFFESIFPDVLLKSHVSSKDFDKINQSTKVLIEMLRDCPEPNKYLNMLDRRQKAKIKPYILQEDARLNHNKKNVELIIADIKDLVNEKVMNLNVVDALATSTDVERPRTIINGVDITDMLIDSRRSNAIVKLMEAREHLEKAKNESTKKVFQERIKAIREEYKDVFEKEYV